MDIFINPGFWTMISGLATASLFLVAWRQLQGIKNTAKADFLFRFNRDFFVDKVVKQMIRTIEEGKPIFRAKRGKFNEYDIDDYLGYFELMQIFINKRDMDINDVDEMFGHYIVKAWKNKEIRAYITNLRKDTKDSSYYQLFEQLADTIIKKATSQL